MSLAGKHILQIVPELNTGGVERTTLEMTEAITNSGAIAHIASEGGRMENDIIKAGGILHYVPLKSKNPVQMARNKSQLAKLIDKEAIHLVHARSRAPAWSALSAARAKKIPFVTTYHGAYSGSSAPKIAYNSVMAKGDIVIANSEFINQHIQVTHSTPSSRIVTIPRGVDLSVFDPSIISADRMEAMKRHLGFSPNKTLILLPARLTEWKGQTETIHAIAGLAPETRARIRCVLAGDPQGRDAYVDLLQSLISEYKLEECVVIKPHITDMPAALLAADWVLAPSQRPEAFGRVAAEASAMGKPVITTAHGGGLETVIHDKTGLHIPPMNVPAFTAALNKAINLPPEICRDLGINGRQYIQSNFTKTLLQERTLNVYAQLLR